MKTIFRSACKGHFVQLPNAMLRDNSISLRARGLLAMVLTNQEDWVVSRAWVREQVPEGRQAVASTFRELEVAGYAVMNEIRDPKTGKIYSNVWVFYDSPVPEVERSKSTQKASNDPLYGNPHSGLPDSGNPEGGLSAPKNTRRKEDHQREHNGSTEYAGQQTAKGRPKIDPLKLREYERIYDAYPRKAARPVALLAIQKAALANPGVDLLAAVCVYAQYCSDESVEPRFIPMPATWFNQERWKDDLISQKPRGSTNDQLNRDLELVRNSPAFPGGIRYFTEHSKAEYDAYAAARIRIKHADPAFNFQTLK